MNSMPLVVPNAPIASHIWVKPYYSISQAPEYYERSDAQFCKIDFSEFMRKRGLGNKSLASLTQHLPPGAYIAGGYIASIIRKDATYDGDIDIFFNGPDAFINTVKLFLDPPQDSNAWMFRGYETTATLEELSSEYSDKIKLVNLIPIDSSRPHIQLIKMVWYDDAPHVIDSFDFTAIQFCVDKTDLHFHPLAFHDVHTKNLVINRTQYPTETIYRLAKYSKKGYSISRNMILSVVKSIREAEDIVHRFHYEDKDA